MQPIPLNTAQSRRHIATQIDTNSFDIKSTKAEYPFSSQCLPAYRCRSKAARHRFPRHHRTHLSSNGDLDLDTGIDVDNDLLDNLGGGSKAVHSVVSSMFCSGLVGQHILDETLVDAHLEAVPGLGTLTARGLAGGDLEALGRKADGALGAEVLVLSTVDDLSADLLEDLDLAGGEGDADLVALL